MITAGDLDRRIVIEYKSVTPDPVYGTEVVSWISLMGYEAGSPSIAKTVAAQIQDLLPGRQRAEGVVQGLEISRNLSRLRIRYRTGIDSSMRVREPDRGNVTYNIVSGPAEIGRREFLEFMLERYSTEGGNS